MPNAKMSNETKCRTDKISNWTKRRTDKISKVIKAEWDKTSNGTNCRTEITSNETKCRLLKCRMGQNVDCQNVEWDKMSKSSISCRSAHVHVHIHVSLSLSVSICPCPRPCVPVRGPGHISPVKFSRIYDMCTYSNV